MNQFQQIHLHKCKHTQKLIHNREYHFKDKKIQDEIKKKEKILWILQINNFT